MASQPNFAGNIRTEIGTVDTANTNRDGTGTIVTIFNTGPSGSLVTEITIKFRVTTTAGTIRLFIHDGVATHKLWREVEIPANTVSASNAAYETTFRPCDPDNDGFPLRAGYSIGASTEKAEAANIIIAGGDY